MLGRKALPAIEGHQSGIGAEHGVVGQVEAGGAVEQLQGQIAALQGLPEKSIDGTVAGTRFTTGGGHQDRGTIGGQLQHRLGIGLAQLSEFAQG